MRCKGKIRCLSSNFLFNPVISYVQKIAGPPRRCDEGMNVGKETISAGHRNPEFLFTNKSPCICDTTMDESTTFFKKDAYARQAGIELVEVSKGAAKVKMDIHNQHKNSHGTVHGGAIFTLADTAFALASNSHGIPAAAINAHISYVKSATSGTLFAEAEEFSLNPKIATYIVHVTDQNGDRIALFEGMVYRKTPRA